MTDRLLSDGDIGTRANAAGHDVPNAPSLPQEVSALFGDPDFDMTFPYLVHVQEMHDLIVTFCLQSSTHPLIREFLARYPTRPGLPPELNAMIAVYRAAYGGVAA